MVMFEFAPPRYRLAFVLEPAPLVAAQLEGAGEFVRHAGGLTGRPLPASRLHLSLHQLADHADLPQELIRAASAAASAVRFAPFQITFDRAITFADKPRNRPLVLLASAADTDLRAFREHLGHVLASAGIAWRGTEAFAPHVTLLYDDQALPERPIEPVTWAVGGFSLVLTADRQRTHLRTWSLRA
jgi:2'-5' RNA ligase